MKEDRSRASTWYARTEGEMKIGWRRMAAENWWSRYLSAKLVAELGHEAIYAERMSFGWWCSFLGPSSTARGGESGKTRAEAAANLIRAKLRQIEKDAAAAVVTA